MWNSSDAISNDFESCQLFLLPFIVLWPETEWLWNKKLEVIE